MVSFSGAKLRPQSLARQRLAVVVVGLAALAARAAVLPILPVPAPHILDEFSHLLLADTLLHGRLANSTPSMWIHFETPYVLMHPTYASMYPPAQGLVLAIGQLVAHQPFVGVWLSLGVMCAAICWMLQGWMPAEWAFLGGLLAVMRLAVFSYWADSYLGGAVVAATGGALVLGALPRIMRFARAGDALLMALGLAILANSRPYEGFVFAVPCAVALLIWFSQKRGPAIGKSVRTVLFPLSLALIATALAMGYYSWRVTGNPFHMPYQVDRDTYHVAPYFLWQSPKPEPVYHHEALRDLYARDDLGMYHQTRSVPSLLGIWFVRSLSLWCFYLGPVLTLPLVMAIATTPYGLGWSRIDSQARFLFLASASFHRRNRRRSIFPLRLRFSGHRFDLRHRADVHVPCPPMAVARKKHRIISRSSCACDLCPDVIAARHRNAGIRQSQGNCGPRTMPALSPPTAPASSSSSNAIRAGIS